MKDNDAQLIEGCLRKDERAYRALYERYAPLMYGVCLRYSSSTLAAEDVLHDGFIKVFDNLHRLKEPAALEGWMRRIMVCTAINAQRRKLPLASNEADCNDIGGDCNGDEIIDSIDAAIVVQTMQQLPDSFRTVLNLCEVEGYSYDEAAKIMGIKTSSIRATMAKAKKALAQKLDERQ